MFGSFGFSILAATLIAYTVLDYLALVAGIVLSPYPQSAWMLVYMPLHIMAELAVMRFVRLSAILQELLSRSSYPDPYVPPACHCGRCSVSSLLGIRRLRVLCQDARFVAAYSPTGGLFSVAPGDRAVVGTGRRCSTGAVTRIEPVAAVSPGEFRGAFATTDRRQLFRIAFDPGQSPPP
jgi:hypothetical protein